MEKNGNFDRIRNVCNRPAWTGFKSNLQGKMDHMLQTTGKS